MQKAVEITHNGQILRGMEHIPDVNKSPAVILFHGFTGTKLEPHRMFLKISRALEKEGIASFRFDFLGSGESDGDFEDMTVMSELRQAHTILDYVKTHPSIDENQIYVLGFSMGGLVASLLAGERNSEIAKLILLAAGGTIPQLSQQLRAQSPYLNEKKVYDIGGNLVSEQFFDELKDLVVWENAARFKQHVLLIHGTNDEAIPANASKLYKENCYPNATVQLIEGADHGFNSFVWEQKVISFIIEFVTKE